MLCLVAIGASTTLAACSSSSGGPTSKEAGARMSKDSIGLLSAMQTLLKAPEPYTVTDDGSMGRACGYGKQKRTFAAHMKIPASPNIHTALMLDAGDVSGFLSSLGYEQDAEAGSVRKSGNKYVETLFNKKVHTRITVMLMAYGNGTSTLNYTLTATTDCLEA
jgi:hypothetical protein